MPQGREWEYARQQGRQRAAGAPAQGYAPGRIQRQAPPEEVSAPVSASPESQVVGGLTTLLGGILSFIPGTQAAGITLMAAGANIPAWDKAARTGDLGDIGAATGLMGQFANAIGQETRPPRQQQQQQQQRPATPAVPYAQPPQLAGARGIGGAGAANAYAGNPTRAAEPWWLRPSRSPTGGWPTR